MKKSIDSQRKNDQEHSEYEEYLESIVDTMREALLILDKDLRVISANTTFYERFKVNPNQTEKVMLYELGNGQWNMPVLKKLLEEILPTHNPFNNFRVEHDFPQIGRKVMLLNARQIKGKGKWKDRILLAIEDITQYDNDRIEKEDFSKRERIAVEELKTSETRFKTLIEKSTDAIQLVSPEGEILYTSESIKNVLGYTAEELKGLGVTPFLHSDDLPYFLRKLQELISKPGGQITLHYRVKHKDGSWAWLETTGVNHLHTPNINALVGTFRNITERKKSEERIEKLNKKLKEKVNELETLIELVPVGIGISEDPAATKIHVNRLFREMLRVRPGQNASKTAEDGTNLNFRVLRDGKEVAGNDLPMQKSGLTGKSIFNDVIDIVHQDGSVINLLCSTIPIMDSNNNVRIVVGAFLDITERKKLEKQKDEFLGIASHELKTPVTSIKAYGQVLQTMFKKQGEKKAVEALQKMDAQVNKLTNLIGDLLDVTKVQSGRLEFHEEIFEFNELVNEIVDDMQLTSDKHVLQKMLGKVPKVYGDKERIGQVITNLLANAIKYSPHSETINITTKTHKDNVIVCVQDFGVGIPSDKQDRIFEQFFRVSGPNHSTVPGMGLGLYISSEIIKRQGGRIWVESIEGKGSTFYISLPIKQQASKRKNKLAEEDIKHE